MLTEAGFNQKYYQVYKTAMDMIYKHKTGLFFNILTFVNLTH